MSSSFDKFAILDSFLDEVGSYLPEIEGNLNRLEQTPDDVEALEEAYRRTHTISGSASMMDFPGLSQVAHSMEDVLGDALDEVLRLDNTVIGLLRRSLERVRQSLEVIKTGATDDGRIVAEDTMDHASFRQQREARSADGAVIQDAIIVTPEVSASADAKHAGKAEAGEDKAEERSASEAWSSAQAEPATAAAGGSGPADWLSMLQPPDADNVTGDGQGASITAPVSQAREPITQPLEVFPVGEASAPEAEPAAEASEAIIAPQEKFAPSLSEPAQSAALEGGAPTAPSPDGQQPSLAEMLAAFRAPADGEWPEPHAAPAELSTAQASATAGGSGDQSSTLPTPGSWLDAFRAPPVEPTYQAPLSQSYETSGPRSIYQPPEPRSGSAPLAPAASFPPASSLPVSESDGFSSMLAWQDVIEQEAHVRQGAASLKETLAALRAVAKAIEDERSELRGFLDGSKDAIDRLEDWAGKAMGLNLRQSPDHVRRYLPLSVLWVVTTRLKKVLGLLKDASSALASTDGEMSAATAQLGESIRKCGTLISSVLSMATSTQEGGGFSATLAHISWTPPAGPTAPAVEDQPLPSRSDLERELRDQIIAQVRREEVARLRQEIEIEVRQQFLAQIAASRIAPPVEPEPWPSEPVMPASQPAPAPRQKKVTRATDQSEEALEVFRAEAEEHLQHIGAGVTAMEKAPEDREVLQGIRRATHTLKGAAAMMGFASIADLSHISEDLLDRIMEGSITINTDVLSLILDTSEALELLVAGKTADRGGDQAVVDALRPRYRALLSQDGEAENADAAGGPGTSNFSAIEAEAVEELANRALQTDEDSGRLVALARSGSVVDKEELTVRIRLKKLDELVNLFGELLVNRATLEERLNRLTRMVSDVGLSSTRLQEVGSQLESRFEAATLPAGQMARSLALETTSWAVSTTGPMDRSASMVGRPLALPPSALGGSPSSNADHLADFDELELDRYSEFHRLSRGLSEGISDMATLSNEMEALIRECETIFNKENRLSSAFQDQLLKVRLVPLSTMVPRLYRAARAVALRQGKEIELVMEGEETEVDRTVYEEVAGPLLHLVRNSVTHGIESPEVREAAGKPRAGQIKLSASYEGNQVVITVRDDGTGIDAERVRGTAIARGLLDARAPLSEQSVLNLIFRPGFSTAESITEESGRGVGLDVVHDVVSRLRGSVEVESTPGNGSAFTMKFPISLQIQRAVLVRADTQTYAIPMAVVEQIGRLDYCEPTTLLGAPAVKVRGETYLLLHIANLLDLPVGKVDDRASVLLISAGRQRYALIVDGVVGKQEIVAKNLGLHLREVRGVAGATILGNGQVVLILEILDLLAQRAQTAVPAFAAAHSGTTSATISTVPTRSLAPTWTSSMPAVGRGQLSPRLPVRQEEQYVLVVDDSPSVRRVVSNVLKTAGWEVQTARDGVEALEVAAKKSPAAVLLDIEMPRMDGYELISTLRSQEQYRHLPLIVLTSRAANKHHQRAMQLGADAYLVKPYQDEELLNTLTTLVHGAQRRER
jgi:chemotaxis protein histidine kinase CheA/ActR/RegA family two-component response regulator